MKVKLYEYDGLINISDIFMMIKDKIFPTLKGFNLWAALMHVSKFGMTDCGQENINHLHGDHEYLLSCNILKILT